MRGFLFITSISHFQKYCKYLNFDPYLTFYAILSENKEEGFFFFFFFFINFLVSGIDLSRDQETLLKWFLHINMALTKFQLLKHLWKEDIAEIVQNKKNIEESSKKDEGGDVNYLFIFIYFFFLGLYNNKIYIIKCYVNFLSCNYQ